MSETEQTKEQSILDHGISVRNHLFDLIDHLKGNNLKYEWKLPTWLLENKKLFIDSLLDDDTLELYTIYHDCGKPFCIQIDTNGNKHFPNHAEVSHNIFKQYFNNPIAANLILHDMDIHLLKSDGIEDFCKNPQYLILLLTGLAELHSNAKLFGGLESTSFKIKWKSLNQRGKQILNNKNKK